MSYGITELEAFGHFLDGQIASGRADLTPEEALVLWQEIRGDLPESLVALNESFADVETGVPGKPLRDFITEFQAKHQIPSDE